MSRFYHEPIEDGQGYILFLDGYAIPGSQSQFQEKGSLYAHYVQLEDYNPFYDIPLKEFLEYFAEFSFEFSLKDQQLDSRFFGVKVRSVRKEQSFILRFEANSINWTNPFSILELHNAMISEVWYCGGLHGELDGITPLKDLKFKIENPELTLGKMINLVLPDAEKKINQIFEKLFSNIEPKTLVTFFSFPEEVRISCEQYLLYFVKFLRDVGIEATAKINERADGTLFSVTPKNAEDALEKINLALELYLHLPASPAANLDLLLSADIATQQLAAQLDHLRAELRLSYTAMQLQNATIEAKDTIIDQQRQIINQQVQAGTIIAHSLVSQPYQPSPTLLSDSKKGDKEESEEIVRGVVAVKKWEWEMFEIDFPNLIRRLKEWFKARDVS